MKPFLLKGLFFLLSTIPLYLILLVMVYQTGTAKYIPNILDKSKNNGFLLSRLREVPNYKNVDILFLGSSHACRQFDPRIFKEYGFTSFNLGSGAQTPINSQFLLTKYIDNLNPKHLIFEVYFLFFANNGVESALDILGNSEIDPSNLALALSKPDLKILNTLSLILVNRAFEPVSEISEHQFKTDKYIPGGYIEKTLPDSINRRLSTSQTKRKISILPDQLNALTKIIELAEHKGITITLVAAPVTSELLNQFENYSEFYRQIKGITDKYNVNYIDYNHQMLIHLNSRTDFYDSNHLTQKGVDKFCRHFIKNFLPTLNKNNVTNAGFSE